MANPKYCVSVKREDQFFSDLTKEQFNLLCCMKFNTLKECKERIEQIVTAKIPYITIKIQERKSHTVEYAYGNRERHVTYEDYIEYVDGKYKKIAIKPKRERLHFSY